MAHVIGKGASSKVVKAAAREALHNFCRYVVDLLRSPKLQSEGTGKAAIISGWENLDKALAEGKGAILVSLHLGNWDIGAMAIAARSYPLNIVVNALDHSRLDHFVQGLRTSMGIKVINTKQEIAKMVQALRQNEILALLMDCPQRCSGVRVKFCDALSEVPAGAATLALRTGAKIVPSGLVRLPDNTFRGSIGQHLDFQPSGKLSEDIQSLTQAIMGALERLVREYPEQWCLFQRMWQRPPATSA